MDSAYTGIAIDSRQVQRGDVFAAIVGNTVDGRQFIPQAIENGAAAVLFEDGTQVDCQVPVILTDNIRLKVAKLAAKFYQPVPETIVAVTGTNGKTSVAQLFQQLHDNAAAIGTIGITTKRAPNTAALLRLMPLPYKKPW